MYLVVFGSIVTFTAYVWLLGVTSATRVATHTYVNPVIAVFLGWALAGEQFTLMMMIASAVIVLSVYLVLET
jgi:drug/metabolite transporter (DMT)-like permease